MGEVGQSMCCNVGLESYAYMKAVAELNCGVISAYLQGLSLEGLDMHISLQKKAMPFPHNVGHDLEL